MTPFIESAHGLMATIAAMGAAIGLGQLLSSADEITLRLAVGRAVVSAGISLSAGAGLMLLPTMSPVAVIGLAALLGSLGTSGLERMAKRAIGPKAGD